jgi:hypothetical protein
VQMPATSEMGTTFHGALETTATSSSTPWRRDRWPEDKHYGESGSTSGTSSPRPPARRRLQQPDRQPPCVFTVPMEGRFAQVTVGDIQSTRAPLYIPSSSVLPQP